MNDLDKSNGYEEIAPLFIVGRNTSEVGASVVADWSRTLAPGAMVLDLLMALLGTELQAALLRDGDSTVKRIGNHSPLGMGNSPDLPNVSRRRLGRE